MSKLKSNNLIEYLVIILSSCILLNYFFYFLFFNIYLIKFIIFIFFTSLFYFMFIRPENFYLKLTIVFLSLLLLGNPTDAWDGWAVWLFKAKRIYTDQSIYVFLDNYAPFSNNDHPLIVPAFCSSIAFFFGKYNEIFPKLGIFFLSVPILVYSINFFKQKWHFFFICASLYIIANFFINAYLDGLIALYFSFIFFLVFNIFLDNKFTSLKFFNLFLFVTILSLIKNEGIVLVFLILMQVFLSIHFNKENKKYEFLFYLCFSIVPIFFWKFLLYKNNISNFHFNKGFDLFYDRLINLGTYKIIFYYFINFKFLLFFSIIIFISFIFKNNKKIKLSLFFGLFYLLIVLIVNLISPMDFYWGLSASFKRILITPTYLFFVISFYEIYLNRKKLLQLAYRLQIKKLHLSSKRRSPRDTKA